MATSEDIQEAAATAMAAGISSASHNGRSTSAIDPLRQLEFADKLAAREALAEADAAGNSVGRILSRKARFAPGGTTS